MSRWSDVERLYHAALEREASLRADFLAEICAGDEALRLKVESLLAYEEQAKDFIEAPAYEYAAELFAETQAEIAIGECLGPYRILRPIGAGGMGEVYLARDTKLGRRVALKLLPAQFTTDADRVRRFEQEARGAAALNHPNIITIHDVGDVNGVHFIATEFIEGQTLRQQMMNGEMSISIAIDIAAQVAAALAAAHEAGIIHRDIKPENVMVRPDGLVKVLDFGLAKLTEGGQEDKGTRRKGENPLASLSLLPPLSSTGVVMGTARYMSPEQARGLKVDARTDIFSLGVALYEMVAGNAPFTGPSACDVIAALLEHEPVPLTRNSPEAPAELERIVSKALRKDREERYQTINDMLVELKGLKRELEFEARMGRANQPTAPGRRRAIELAPEPAARRTPNAGSLVRSLVRGMVRHKQGVVAALATLAVALAVIAYFIVAGKAVDSIAVLPFASAGADPGAKSLADGVPESVADSLSQLPDLKVIPFFSTLRYKGQEKTPQAIGRELGVRAVVRGKIIERGDDVGISVELVDTRNGGLLWGRQYRRKAPDIFAAPAEIAQGVSEKLRPGLSRETQQRLNKRSTDNAEAYRSYLMGRYYWNKRNPAAIKQAIAYFEQAIDRDPVYALAYAGLADSYAVSSSGLPPQERMPRAKSAAMKALDIDETLAEAHASLALVKYRYDWDWPGAEAEFKRAVALNHNYATAHEWYGVYLGQFGRFDQALAELKQAQELEPLSDIILVDTGMIFYSARQYDQALTQCRKALELTPDFGLAHQYIGRAYEQKRMYQEAVDEYLKGRALQRRDGPEIIESLREAYRISGWRGYLRKALDLALAKEQAKKEPGSALTIAELYTRLGEKDSALVWLERAYQERDDRLVALKAGPRFDELRSDPRFADLLRRMGLEQ